jgi:beta-glucosidase
MVHPLASQKEPGRDREKLKVDKLEFPKGFLWGAATSAHQVEGGTHNNWSEWEQSSGRLVQLENDGLIKKYGRENYVSGNAADHYHRYREDFALERELGHNATRISIEWSRIEPEEGRFNADAIAHYQDVVAAIRASGMEPFVTLWHWTVPTWFRDKHEFERHANIRYFTRFVEKMVTEFPGVKFWITLNEPEVYASGHYLRGEKPPQKKDPFLALMVYENLISAHRAAYRAIKKNHPQALVGIAKNNIQYEAYKNRFWNKALKRIADWGWNFYFLDHIKDSQDFIGLNHYFHNRIDGWFGRNENKRMNEMGWELYPEAMFYVLSDLKKYQVPIYITESGLADAHDAQRGWFLRETLAGVHRAIVAGADVRGYLYWSLMDNFEWQHGFWPRFGLIEINYATQERKPRRSAFFYKKICEDNALQI